jgi:hypothetical protein
MPIIIIFQDNDYFIAPLIKHCAIYGAILCRQKALTVEMPRNP